MVRGRAVVAPVAPMGPGSAATSRDATLPGGDGTPADGRFVELTRTEYQLLELLLRNPRQVLTHSLIYERVWGYDFGPSSNALRVYVGYLRRKLEQAGARPLIHNVRGVGYVLREP
jgi:two-component system response regulator MprA